MVSHESIHRSNIIQTDQAHLDTGILRNIPVCASTYIHVTIFKFLKGHEREQEQSVRGLKREKDGGNDATILKSQKFLKNYRQLKALLRYIKYLNKSNTIIKVY